MSALRENWRIVMLAIFLIVSGVVMFVPAGPFANTDGPTNLQYGLDLDGGTRVRAPPVGMYADEVDFGGQDTSSIEVQMSESLNVSGSDVNARYDTQNSGTVEVYVQNVTESEFRSAASDAGLDISADQIQQGVSAETRSTLVETLGEKINRGGLTGAKVTEAEASGNDQTFVIVEVPGANRSEVVSTVQDRGLVEVVGEVKNENGTTVANETLLTGDEISVGQVRQQSGTWWVDITVPDDQAAERFATRTQELGFTTEPGIGNCDRGGGGSGPGSYCLLTVLNGEVVHSNGMGDLAESINNGDFESDPGFLLGAANQSNAGNVRLNLQVGSLPTTLAVQQQGTAYFISPSLASEFKVLALLVGIVAWIGVSAMVFLRYKKTRVAVPMLFTAMAEVFILMAFAVLVGLRVELSHIAGFIAVIGTGVDDLVIIADEILQQGKVATGRVFQNRFRKAFWVIGAAAATTIIAMSPLAVLSLGDLRGFAIITIAGVLIGVLITRPAYGDILRNLVLGDEELDA
jgi:preprotein translocase subunit SecD